MISVITTFRSQPKYRSYGSGSDPSKFSYLSTELSTYKYIVIVKMTTKVNAIINRVYCSLQTI